MEKGTNKSMFWEGFFIAVFTGFLFMLAIFGFIKLYFVLNEQTFWSFILVVITIIGWIISYYINNHLHKKELERATKIELYKKLSFDLYSTYKKDADYFSDAMQSFDFLDSLLHPGKGKTDEKRWREFVSGLTDYFYNLQTSYFTIRNLIKSWNPLFDDMQDKINDVDSKWEALSEKYEHFRRNISWLGEDDYYKFRDGTNKANKDTVKRCDDFLESFEDLLDNTRNILTKDIILK